MSLTVPPESSSGKRLRLKGLGVKQRDGSVGDLIVELQIRMPTNLDEKSIELIEEFGKRNRMPLRDEIAF